MLCSLCNYETDDFERIKGMKNEYFLLCPNCKLIFRPRYDQLDSEREKARYLTHNNSLENKGYVDFLLHPYRIAKKHIVQGRKVLDYGCGYNPVFSKLLMEKGFTCDFYDPYFFPEGIRQSRYRNIFSLETVEHFNDPYSNWDRLDSLLEEGGTLTVMTEFWRDIASFSNWHYSSDETHNAFYHPDTLIWLADHFDWQIVENDQERVVVYKKTADHY